MFTLIYYNFGSEETLANFGSYPDDKQIAPYLERFDRANRAKSLADNGSIAIDVAQWIAIREVPDAS